VRSFHRKHRVGLFGADYLQLIGSSDYRGSSNRVQVITEITTGLKALAKEINAPGIILSQLNRGVEQREDKRPHLADLRESGSIEQDADVVLFVYRDEYYLERANPPIEDFDASTKWRSQLEAAAGKVEIIVAKNRHGQVGTVELLFDAGTTTFKNKEVA
jgi:replicative DNA helicase